MNRYFEFSKKQLNFIFFATSLILISSIYLFINAYAIPQDSPDDWEVFVGNNNSDLRGLFILDPNISPADSLELLPGIGKVLADRIVEYRHNHKFEELLDITNIEGIGARKFERIRPYLKIERK